MKTFTTFPIKKKSKAKTVSGKNSFIRRQTDPWYKATANARSILSSAIRKYINNPNTTSNRCKELTGLNLDTLFDHLEGQAIDLGYSLMTDYGKQGVCLEIDHWVPLSTYEPLSETAGIEVALQTAFEYSNLRITFIAENRNHSLKPKVVEIIVRKVKNARNKKAA